MRPLLAAPAFGLTLVAGAALAHARLPAGLVALVALTVGVGLAALASSGLEPLSVTSGALGALVCLWLLPSSTLLAGATLVTAAFLARALRTSTRRRFLLHLAASATGGMVATVVAVLYQGSTWTGRAAAVVVSGLFACAALLVPADDRLAFALAIEADGLPAPASIALLRGAFLRRLRLELGEALPALARRRFDRALGALLALGKARSRAPRLAAGVLDRQLERHVEELERLLSVATEAGARAAGLDEEALTALRAAGDDLQTEASTLAEVDALSFTAPPGER